MIIWSGAGLLVALIAYACGAAAIYLGEILQIQQTNWLMLIALIIAGVICWFLGRYMNRSKDKVMVDKETGEEVVVRGPKHKLFFINMEYWGPILAILGIVDLFVEII